MQKLMIYLKEPYAQKGFIKATLDLALRALTLGVWVYLMYVLGLLLVDAFARNYDPAQRMWWFSYCFIICLGASWLAYIILFVRDYYQAED